MPHSPAFRPSRLGSLAIALAVACLAGAAEEEGVRAGEPFSGAKGWINTAAPLTRGQLAGQVVLLDFWTYCCINCMHVIPELKFLEAKYHDQPLVVVGVHSGKFDQEKDLANIRAAVMRHDVEHPVAVDSDFVIWKRFGVRAWPTLILLDTRGKPIAGWSGEGNRDAIDQAIAHALASAKLDGSLAAKPLRFAIEQDAASADLPLSFPGKVLADAERQRLFISDTGHHRVLVADLAGNVRQIIGSGAPALTDGTAAAAAFNEPQGLALSADGATLYVADRQNHALRAVDLATLAVTTLAGTGEQGRMRSYSGKAAGTAINSPWDLVRVGDQLFIAMAGPHQIWRMGLADGSLAVHAGTGRELCIDGPNRTAGFAQPSGLASDGTWIYVADSEVSSIRAVAVDPQGVTRTIAGSGDLFGFGLQDGKGEGALFQHPLGVALAQAPGGVRLAVTDSFNHALRLVDPADGTVTTLPAGELPLHEPGGLSASGGILYVADTNHHRLVRVDLADGKRTVLPVTLPR